MTKDELAEKIKDLANEARAMGDLHTNQNLSYVFLELITGQELPSVEMDRADIAALTQALAIFAMHHGFKYTAYNLSFVCAAMASGEEMEVLVGSEMAKHAEALKKGFLDSDLLWPDELE